eukprot:3048415-Amphidinium_carterae.1
MQHVCTLIARVQELSRGARPTHRAGPSSVVFQSCNLNPSKTSSQEGLKRTNEDTNSLPTY